MKRVFIGAMIAVLLTQYASLGFSQTSEPSALMSQAGQQTAQNSVQAPPVQPEQNSAATNDVDLTLSWYEAFQLWICMTLGFCSDAPINWGG